MQTQVSSGVVPAGSLFTGEGSMVSAEIDYRMERLAGEALRNRLPGHRVGIRHSLGHWLIALGRAVHGAETEPTVKRRRPALHAG